MKPEAHARPVFGTGWAPARKFAETQAEVGAEQLTPGFP